MCPTVNLVTPWLFGVSGLAAFGDIAVLGGCELHQISSNNGRDGFVFQQNGLNLVTKHESLFPPHKKKNRNWFLPWDHQKEKLFWSKALPRRQLMPPRKPTAMRSRPKPMRLGNIWRRWSTRSINPKMEMFSMKILGMNWAHHQIWGVKPRKMRGPDVDLAKKIAGFVTMYVYDYRQNDVKAMDNWYGWLHNWLGWIGLNWLHMVWYSLMGFWCGYGDESIRMNC